MTAASSEMTIGRAVIAIRDARNPALDMTHKMVLTAIASRLPNPEASYPTMARDAGVSVNTLRRVLRDLERWAMVRRAVGDGRYATSVYALDLLRIGTLERLETSHGETSHGETSHGETSHGETSHGETSHGETSHGETSHGETSHGETSHGETRGIPPWEGRDPTMGSKETREETMEEASACAAAPELPMVRRGDDHSPPSPWTLTPSGDTQASSTTTKAKRGARRPRSAPVDLDPAALTPEEVAVHAEIAGDADLARICAMPATTARDLYRLGAGLDVARVVCEAGIFLRTDKGRAGKYSDGARFLQNQVRRALDWHGAADPKRPIVNGDRETAPPGLPGADKGGPDMRPWTPSPLPKPPPIRPDFLGNASRPGRGDHLEVKS